MAKKIPCACGCGTFINRHNRYGRRCRFVNHHGSRGPDWWDRQGPRAPCACGCGAMITPKGPSRWGRHRRYLRGHNRRGIGPGMRPIADRFWEKVRKAKRCWEWIGQKDKDGYGRFYVTLDGVRKKRRAHRVAWRLIHGRWPQGEILEHVCNNPSCVNVTSTEHVIESTQRENIRRAALRNRPVHTCGLPYDGTYLKRGWPIRYCKTCRRLSSTRYYRSHRIRS